MISKIKNEDFIKSFEYVFSLWPQHINVEEQYHFQNGGSRIPALTSAHETVEEYLEKQLSGMDFHIANAIEFAIFTYFHVKIRNEKNNFLETNSVDLEAIRKILNSYEAWEVE